MYSFDIDKCSKKEIIEFNWYNALQRGMGKDYCLIKTESQYVAYINAIDTIRKRFRKIGRRRVMMRIFNYIYYAIFIGGTLASIFFLDSVLQDNDSWWVPLASQSPIWIAICLFFVISMLLNLPFGKTKEEPTVLDVLDSYINFIARQIVDGNRTAIALAASKKHCDKYEGYVSLRSENPYAAYRNGTETIMVMMLADLLCGIECDSEDVYSHYRNEYYTFDVLSDFDEIGVFHKFIMNRIPSILLSSGCYVRIDIRK